MRKQMAALIIAGVIGALGTSFGTAQQTQATAQTQIAQTQAKNKRYMVAVRGNYYFGKTPIVNLIDENYSQPEISGFSGELRIKISPHFSLGIEAGRKNGKLIQKKTYSFAPVLGIPDLTDTYLRKHSAGSFRINAYFVVLNKRWYELALGLGGGVDVYTYRQEFTIQYFAESVIRETQIGSGKIGVLPGAQMIISNRIEIGRYVFLMEPTVSENGFSVALGGGVNF